MIQTDGAPSFSRSLALWRASETVAYLALLALAPCADMVVTRYCVGISGPLRSYRRPRNHGGIEASLPAGSESTQTPPTPWERLRPVWSVCLAAPSLTCSTSSRVKSEFAVSYGCGRRGRLSEHRSHNAPLLQALPQFRLSRNLVELMDGLSRIR